MCWDTLSGAALSSCEWVPSDAEADIAMQSEGSLVDWAAVPSDMFQCSVNAEFEGLTPLERAMGHALSPTSQQRHKLESSAFECAQGASRDDERRHHQRAAAADRRKLLLDDLRACVFRGVFNWGSLGSSRKVGSKFQAIQVLEEAWRHTLTSQSLRFW